MADGQQKPLVHCVRATRLGSHDLLNFKRDPEESRQNNYMKKNLVKYGK